MYKKFFPVSRKFLKNLNVVANYTWWIPICSKIRNYLRTDMKNELLRTRRKIALKRIVFGCILILPNDFRGEQLT